jgi:hypothetical protein
MTMKRQTAIAAALIVLLCPAAGRSEEGYSVSVKGSVSGYAATGDRKLDDTRDLTGSNEGLQTWFKTPANLTLYFDGRYFGRSHGPENILREGYADWDAGRLTVRAGKQLIVWGRADKFNPTDVITPRNYELLSSDDDDQRFGVEGVQAKYHFADEYSFTAVGLPVFQSSRVSSGLLPAGITRDRSHESYASDNAQYGFKLDRSGESLDWSASYYRGFSTLPEVVLSDTMSLALENRRIWMAGLDFAATHGAWGIRGEAASVNLEKRAAMPELYPHSYVYTVLGVERTVSDTLTINLQWLHKRVSDFSDPRTAPLPFEALALGNALIHDQFDRVQDGVSLSLRDKWLLDTLRAEISMIYFIRHRDYLVKPELRYALNDQWSAAILADLYHGPDDSFLGGLRKNSLAYAELRYQFGPVVK